MSPQASVNPEERAGTARPVKRATRSKATSAVRLKPRSAATILVVSLIGSLANLWPLLVEEHSAVAGHSRDAPMLFAILLPLMLVVVLAEIADGGMDAKAVAMLGVLSAVDAVLRPLGAGTGGIEVMFFLLVLGGRVFGAGFGFALGATSMFASAVLTAGIGPWLPYQMLAAAWVAMGAGLLPWRRGLRWPLELLLLCVYGAFASLAYGFVLNMSFWPFATGDDPAIMPVPGAPLGDNLARFVAYTLATSLGWDLGRVITNVALILVAGRPIMVALRRASRRAAFDATPRFAEGSRAD